MNIFSTKEIPSFTKNVLFAVVAQGTGLLGSLVVSLVIPKALGLEDYAYWQMFSLYSGYTGLLLFGVNDGIYLRLGGKKYDNLDFGELKAQLVIILAVQLAIDICLAIVIMRAPFDDNRRLVLLLALLYGLFFSARTCLGYIFQSTNLTQLSSISNFIAGFVFLLVIAGAMLLGAKHFYIYIIIYISVQIISLIYCVLCGKRLFLHRTGNIRQAAIVCLTDAGAGLFVTAAFYADLFIIGSTRMLTDWFMGLASFGRLSFAFSMTTFVLTFIGQFAMVAFPVIKRMEDGDRRGKYVQIRDLLIIVLPLIYFMYVPIRHILGYWLPQYEQSFIYLALTLPFCIYSCKSSLLFTTYLKTERGERTLFLCNAVALAVNVILSGVAIIVLRSVELASIGIVFSVVVRDLVYNSIFRKRHGVTYLRESLLEALMAAVFTVTSWFLDLWSVPVIAVAYCFYLLLQRKRTQEVFRFVLRQIA